MIDQNICQEFQQAGYVVVPNLFAPEEVEAIKQHYMAINAQQHGYEGDKPMLGENDPLREYPRIVHPHRWDERTLYWLLDNRLRQWTTALLGREPFAAQTMFYYKPPGARGQALHQDQRSLAVRPGTCLAAWMAVDDCDEENGCMQVVPGTQDLPDLCLVEADTTQSFSSRTIQLPEGIEPVPVLMQAGDVLFFNGQVVHGSFPNSSTTRFRRSLIAHYIVGEAEKVHEFYHPVLTFDGNEVTLDSSEAGGPCGIWVNEDGTSVIEMPDKPIE
jgi:phytanoyl-CoA hydroxylase